MKQAEEKEIGTGDWIRNHIYSEVQVKNRTERWKNSALTTSRLIWIWTILTFAGIGALAFITAKPLYLLLVIPTLIVINIARNIATLIEICGEIFFQMHNNNALQVRQLRIDVARWKEEQTKKAAKLQ